MRVDAGQNKESLGLSYKVKKRKKKEVGLEIR